MDRIRDATPAQIVHLDVTDTEAGVPVRAIDIGIGAENAIKELQKQNKATGERSILQFRTECMEGLIKIVKKLQDKSPLKYPTVRQMSCLDPAKIYTSPELCQRQMKGLVKQFIQDKHLDGGIATGDLITQQFAQLSLDVREREEFLAYKPLEKRLDVFLHTHISHPYPQLWAFIQKLLLLSHGQATVERGFSVNKEVEISNIQEDTIVAHRIVCDYMSLHGGVLKVPLTAGLLSSVVSARGRYRMYLETEKQKKASEAQSLKRKAVEQQLEELKKRRLSTQEVSDNLARDADKLAEKAEGKQGSKMAELIIKSNAFRRSHKIKLVELKSIDDEIVAKREELKNL